MRRIADHVHKWVHLLTGPGVDAAAHAKLVLIQGLLPCGWVEQDPGLLGFQEGEAETWSQRHVETDGAQVGWRWGAAILGDGDCLVQVLPWRKMHLTFVLRHGVRSRKEMLIEKGEGHHGVMLCDGEPHVA